MIKIYTDGACIVTEKKGGSALIVIKGEEIVYQRVFSFPITTNNFCELYAMIEAIRYVLDNNILECQIFSDSKYVVNGINEWMDKWSNNSWKGSAGHQIKNIQLWQDVLTLWDCARATSNISVHYVKAHSSDKWNNAVDKLAKGAIMK